MYDVVIIGAGVIGSAIASEISKYRYKAAVLDRNSDVCEGTSKANSGIVHAGFDAKPGSLMAKMNVKGSSVMEELSKKLDFLYKKNGALVLCFDKDDIGKLNALAEQGRINGVNELSILDKKVLKHLEPNISDKAVAALYVKNSAIVCPFGMTIAFAEHACINGVDILLDHEVEDIKKLKGFYEIKGKGFSYKAKLVINAAGIYADCIHNKVSSQRIEITPRKGEYCVLDKAIGAFIRSTIFQLPTKYGKGVLVTPTVHGNLMIGPTAADIEDKENTATTDEGIKELMEKARISTPNLPFKPIISFTGLRAHRREHDFLIEEVEDAPGFIDVAGIESPGLSAAPAIAEYVGAMVRNLLPAEEKKDFIQTRKGIPRIADMSSEEKKKLIRSDSRFAKVICRCEMITEGEIAASINRACGATTVDGVKRRVRAGTGRCQGGFCNPKVIEILARERKVAPEEITKFGVGSHFIIKRDKEGRI